MGCFRAFVALLTLFPFHISILFHVDLFAAFLRNIPALLPRNLNNDIIIDELIIIIMVISRHLLTLLPVFSDTLLLGHLHTVLDVFAVLLGDVFAALGVGGLALLTRHGLTNKRRVLRVLTNERRVLPDTAAHNWWNNAPLEYPEK